MLITSPFILGIFFKYDMSSIMVRVESRHRSFWGFLVRLCGIVGGIFATSGEQILSFNVFFNLNLMQNNSVNFHNLPSNDEEVHCIDR